MVDEGSIAFITFSREPTTHKTLMISHSKHGLPFELRDWSSKCAHAGLGGGQGS